MRIAVLTDIHANITALEAVVADLQTTAPDLVAVGGDLVGTGSRPSDVLDLVRDRASKCDHRLGALGRITDQTPARACGSHWRDILAIR